MGFLTWEFLSSRFQFNIPEETITRTNQPPLLQSESHERIFLFNDNQEKSFIFNGNLPDGQLHCNTLDWVRHPCHIMIRGSCSKCAL